MSTSLTNIKSASELTVFGDEATSVIKTIANQVSRKVENSTDTEVIFNRLNDIFSLIDYKELSKINEFSSKEKGLRGLIESITKRKEKVVSKYMSLSGQIKGLHTDLINWESQLKDNKNLYDSMEEQLADAKEVLKHHIKEGQEFLTQYENQYDDNYSMNEVEHEMFSVMSEKIQHLNYHNIVCDQTVSSIVIMRRTNYDIYKKLLQIKNTTLPHLEILISQTIKLKESKQMIESFRCLEEKAAELIDFGTNEIITLGKTAVNMTGIGEAEFAALSKNTESLKNAIEEIEQLKERRIQDIAQSISDYRLLLQDREDD